MTFVDTSNLTRKPLVAGGAFDRINSFFGRLGHAAVGQEYLDIEAAPAASSASPVEQQLSIIQDTISDVSMHLPNGFAPGLNRQFANLMDEDAWEDDDELIGLEALSTLLMAIIHTKTSKRPSIGTNGRGSITAAWANGENRLMIECLPSGKAAGVLSRRMGDDLERTAFDPVRTDRLPIVLAAYEPGVWFDG